MLKLEDFIDSKIDCMQNVFGGITVYCKNDAGSNLGSIDYDCGSSSTRVEACVDAGYSDTTSTAGPGCPQQ